MRATTLSLPGVILLEPRVFRDDRGWFMESYAEEHLRTHGIDARFVQDNHSYSAKKGTLRGLHFQNEPMAQSKLVRCTCGAILDVVVDIMKDSITYRQWLCVRLDSKDMKQLFIPKGYAHGFLTLENDTEVQYKVDAYYSPENDRGIRYDDPDIGIDWGIKDPILSPKDSKAPFLRDYDCNLRFVKGR